MAEVERDRWPGLLSPSTHRQGEAPTHDDDFAILATPHQFGDDLTAAEIAAAERVVRAFWPKFGIPHELPEKWR